MMHCQVPLDSFQRVGTASLRDERGKGSEANRENWVDSEERCTSIGMDNWLDRENMVGGIDYTLVGTLSPVPCWVYDLALSWLRPFLSISAARA